MLYLYVSLGVTAICVNFIFLTMMWYKPKVNCSHKHFLSTLAISNLITTVLCLNWDVRMGKWPFTTPPWVCVVQFYGVQIGLFSTSGTVIAMSIDKIIAILRPNLYRNICTVRNTRIVLAIVCVASVVLALLPTRDFVKHLSPVCTVLDLYPRDYGVTIIASVVLVYLLVQIATLSILIASLSMLVVSRGAEDGQRRELVARAQRSTRIIICSLVLYSLTVIPILALLYWLGRKEVDVEYILTHELSLVASCMVICFTYIDPFIYFLCTVKLPVSRKVQPASVGSSNRPDRSIHTGVTQ